MYKTEMVNGIKKDNINTYSLQRELNLVSKWFYYVH